MVVLAIKQSGVSLGKTKEQFKLTFGGSNLPISYVPAIKVDYIIADGKINISYGALELIREYTIPVIWPDYEKNGMLLQPMYAPGTVKLRENQYLARLDERSGYIATQILHSNLQNKIALVKRVLRNTRVDSCQEILGEMEEFYLDSRASIDNLAHTQIGYSERNELMNIEGLLSSMYFQFIDIVSQQFEWKFDHRSRRPAENAFNALLNYGYAILEGNIHRHLFCQGFDPYAGFLHADRAGRMSLSLDLIEPFRQRIDEVILKQIISGKLHEDCVDETEGELRITPEAKSLFIKSIILNWKDSRQKRSLDKEIVRSMRSIHSFLIGTSSDISLYSRKVKDPW